MSSAVAVLRSDCYALRRPPFPRSLVQRQPPPPRAQNSSTRRFYSADCTAVGKPAETNKATVEDGVSRKLDKIILAFDANGAAWKELAEQVKRERRRDVFVCRTIFAGVLAVIYVKHRTKEDTEISAGNN